MLPAAARMRRRQEFDVAIRRGRRAAGRLLTVHLLAGNAGGRPGGPQDRAAPLEGGPRGGRVPDDGELRAEVPSPRVGFIVSRAIGGSVVRNRVRRRLREAARARTQRLPPGSLLVVRAHPRAADARQRELAAELDLVLDRLLRRQVRA